MIKIEDVKNLVNKFPELELIQKNYCGKIHYCGVMKELPEFEVFNYNEDVGDPYVFLNKDLPFRVNADESKVYRVQNDTRYGIGYYHLNEMEKPLKKVIFILDNIILLQKKMKIYEKKLDVENDFKE